MIKFLDLPEKAVFTCGGITYIKLNDELMFNPNMMTTITPLGTLNCKHFQDLVPSDVFISDSQEVVRFDSIEDNQTFTLTTMKGTFQKVDHQTALCLNDMEVWEMRPHALTVPTLITRKYKGACTVRADSYQNETGEELANFFIYNVEVFNPAGTFTAKLRWVNGGWCEPITGEVVDGVIKVLGKYNEIF